jgi:DNA-binding NarL/FixJ family response regulator
MKSARPVSIFIVDDHFTIRSGLAASLRLEGDLQITGEAERSSELPELYRRLKPDLVLMDLQLPEEGGVAATAALLRADPAAHVLIFSTFARIEEINAAMEAGALGYVRKSSSREKLLKAIRTVAAGGLWLEPEISRGLHALRVAPAITAREREILSLIAAGQSNKDIASACRVSEDTVKRHVSHILEKLNVNDRAHASVEAIRRGIIALPE